MPSKCTLGALSILACLLIVAPSLPAQQQDETPPAAQSNAVLRDKLTREATILDQLEARLAALRTKSGPNNPDVLALEAQITALRRSQAEDQRANAAMPEQELADLQAREAELTKTNPNGQNPETEDVARRVKALQDVIDWTKAHGPPQQSGLFEFGGGPAWRLITAASEHFHLPWEAIASLSDPQYRVLVPRFILYVRQPEDILKTYNWLAENNPSMGKWIWKGDAANPDALILIPQKNPPDSPESEIKVRALSLAAIPQARWNAMEDEIETSREEAESFMRRSENASVQPLDGTIQLNPGTRNLVAIGSQSYIDMVASVVAAFQAVAQAQPESAPSPTPGASPPAGSH